MWIKQDEIPKVFTTVLRTQSSLNHNDECCGRVDRGRDGASILNEWHKYKRLSVILFTSYKKKVELKVLICIKEACSSVY